MFERLTVHTPDNFGYAEYQLKQCADEQDAISRLAAYEDTGLTPGRIRELQNAFNILFESERQKQQENEQLRAQVARMREALRKAREAIKAAWSGECSANKALDKASEALKLIDKAIGGKEHV